MIALLPIDIQVGFHDPFWGPRNNPGAEGAMTELFSVFRKRGWPIFHIQHVSVLPTSPLRPGQPGVEFMEFARPRPGEVVFQKNVNSGFIGTGLEAALRAQGIKRVVAMGFTSDHCVSTTTRMAANLGFEVLLSEGALATFDRADFLGQVFPADVIHRTALASLHGEFATVYSQAGLLEVLANS